MSKRPNSNHLWLAMVRIRENGYYLCYDQHDTIHNKAYF